MSIIRKLKFLSDGHRKKIHSFVAFLLLCPIKSKPEQFNLEWTSAPSDGCKLSAFWMLKQARSMCTISLKFKTRSMFPHSFFYSNLSNSQNRWVYKLFLLHFVPLGEGAGLLLLSRYYNGHWFNRPEFNVIVQKNVLVKLSLWDKNRLNHCSDEQWHWEIIKNLDLLHAE